jgi:hypothetical protein
MRVTVTSLLCVTSCYIHNYEHMDTNIEILFGTNRQQTLTEQIWFSVWILMTASVV